MGCMRSIVMGGLDTGSDATVIGWSGCLPFAVYDVFDDLIFRAGLEGGLKRRALLTTTLVDIITTPDT